MNMQKFLFYPLLALSLNISFANAKTCPVTPTEFYGADISEPDPAPAPGKFPADMDEILEYVIDNNIGSIKEFLDHMPDYLRTQFSLISHTKALNETTPEKPGIVFWGDGRFMVNIGTIESAPLYEVADLAYLQDDGDWEFRSLDFNTSPPTLSPNGGNGGECRECHAEGGANNPDAPMRPIWAEYLHWEGIIGGNIDNKERLLDSEKTIIDEINAGRNNNERFHVVTPILYDSSVRVPGHAYNPSLTMSNHELATAAAESIFKRMKRSPNYLKLREELLMLSTCRRNDLLSTSDREKLVTLAESYGANRDDFGYHQVWATMYQAMGINPKHEFAKHFLSKDLASVSGSDIDYNVASANFNTIVEYLVLHELANERADVNTVLSTNPTGYSWGHTCSAIHGSMRDEMDHVYYANFTLKGEARKRARESYFDIDYFRGHQALSSVDNELCAMFATEIEAPNTGGTAPTPTPTPTPTPPPTSTPTPVVTPPSNSDDVLSNGDPVSNIAGARSTQIFYTLEVPAGARSLNFSMSGGQGDADIYVRYGSQPTRSIYDCRPWTTGNRENCAFSNPRSGRYYVMIDGYEDFSGVSLVASYE